MVTVAPLQFPSEPLHLVHVPFLKLLAMAKTAHSVPVHHSHFSSMQSRGNPLPITFPTVPEVNVNGHIFGKITLPNMIKMVNQIYVDASRNKTIIMSSSRLVAS